MKRINELLPADQEKLQSDLKQSHNETLKKTVLPNSWTSALFLKFQARYGHKWTTAIEDIEETAVKEWSEVLAGLTGDQIKHGLDSWLEDWPPSAPEFKKVCLGDDSQKGLSHNTAAYREFRKERLLVKKPDPEVAKSALDEMKSIFK